jgi:hypothetical protein
MDEKQSVRAEEQLNDIQFRMGKRFSFSQKAVLEFANLIESEERILYAEKVSVAMTSNLPYIQIPTDKALFTPAALVLTDRAIYFLTKSGSHRTVVVTTNSFPGKKSGTELRSGRKIEFEYDGFAPQSYHLQYSETDASEELTLKLGEGNYAYLRIVRKYLDPLINAFDELHISEVEYLETVTEVDGSVIKRADGQRTQVFDAKDPSKRDSTRSQAWASDRIPDGPGSMRAKMRREKGRGFKFNVGELDVVNEIVKPWE